MKIWKLLVFAFITQLSAKEMDPVFLDQLRGDTNTMVTALITRSKPLREVSPTDPQLAIADLKVRSAVLHQEIARTFERFTGAIPQMTDIWLADTVIVNAPVGVWREAIDFFEDKKISADHTVELIQPVESKRVREDSADKTTYGVARIRAQEVWKDFGVTGEGIRVGVIDSGWSNHPDLEGKILLSKDFTGETSGLEPNDTMGHGTHCMGIIGGGNASGKSIGAAPGVKFIVARIFGKEKTTLSIVLKAMQWIADPDGDHTTNDGPHIISNSWGSIAQTYLWQPTLRWKKLLGILPVFAAGNRGPRKRSMAAPGGYPHVIAVGATDSKDDMGSFSSRGPSFYYRKRYTKPDLSAPGVDVFSAYIDESQYRNWSGTSMATPFVAGTAALVMEANPSLSVYEVEKILLNSTIDYGSPGKDNHYGMGRIDAYLAVEKALSLQK